MGKTEKPTNKTEPEIIIKRTRYTKTEIEEIQALINEGFSTKEIAIKTNRTVSAISNQKYKLKQNFKAEKRIPTLIEQLKELEEKFINTKITLAIKSDILEKLKKEISEHEALKEEYLELKQAVEFYQTHENQIRQELRALVNNEADAVAIMRIFQFLEKR